MATEKIELNGKVLVARELTVKEEEKVLEDLVEHEMHIIENMFPEEAVSALMLATSLDVDIEALLDLTRSQLLILIGEVKKKNLPLVEAVERLASLCQDITDQGKAKIEADQQEPSTDSAATAAD